jgi:predicted hydrocarbon binding protein
MPQSQDFERAWLAKFSRCLTEIAGGAVRDQVMAGSEALTSESNREDVIAWTKQAMARLESLVEEEKRRTIMTGCACQYPKADLQEAKKVYQETRDVDRVHRMLQEQFESFLRDTLALEDEMVQRIVERGWGLAGVKHGKTIMATKIPKSGYLVEYLKETDPEKRRQIYCHCPRVRDALKRGEKLPLTYCYCGAGFYKGIWEEILGRPVEVEVVKSVLSGDDVCTVAVHLPA